MAHEETSMRGFLSALALSTLLVAPALACAPSAKDGAAGPPIAALLDAQLPKAQLSDADLAKVRDLRQQMAALVATQKFVEARAIEASAMRILGYKKLPSRCGTFAWSKIG
jgi:hypothetical protein